MKNIFVGLFLVNLGIPLASFSSGHKAGAWIADERSDEVPSAIRSVCADPSYTLIDLSNLKLTNEELNIVLEGLVERQKILGDRQTLSFIKLISPSITEEGLGVFLRRLQEGHTVDAGGIIRPDMRKVVMQVALPLTEDLYDRLVSVAPRLLATGNLTLIEGF